MNKHVFDIEILLLFYLFLIRRQNIKLDSSQVEPSFGLKLQFLIFGITKIHYLSTINTTRYFSLLIIMTFVRVNAFFEILTNKSMNVKWFCA